MDNMPHMQGSEPSSGHEHARVHVYRASLSPLSGVLLVAPLLLIFVSLAAALLAGVAVTAFVLPFVLRRRVAQTPRQPDYIELDPDHYRRVDQ